MEKLINYHCAALKITFVDSASSSENKVGQTDRNSSQIVAVVALSPR